MLITFIYKCIFVIMLQVLIDSRDCSVVTHRESVTYLGNHSENNTRLYSVPGLDYVAHEDIMPYRSLLITLI